MLVTSSDDQSSPPVGNTPSRARKKFRQGEISAPEALYEAQDTDTTYRLLSERKNVHLLLLTASGGWPTLVFS